MRLFRISPGPAILAVLMAVYALQAATPLRLHFDSIVLLTSAETAARGGGFLFRGQPTVFPPGYPALLALLMRLHLAHVWVLVSINLIFLAIGFAALRRVLYPSLVERKPAALATCIWMLLSVAVIEIFAIPLTEFCFFGVAMCCLATLKATASRFTARTIAASVLLMAAAICVRRIGLALVPAVLWTVFGHPEARRIFGGLAPLARRCGLAAAGLAAAAVGWLIYSTSTLRDAVAQIRLHGAERVLYAPVWRLRELGELAVNVSSDVFAHTVAAYVLPAIGLGFTAFVVAGLYTRRNRFEAVDIFLVSYICAILAWPFHAPRFWAPVIPLLFAYAWIAFQRVFQGERLSYALLAYGTLYTIPGLVVLIYSTIISFSGARIGDLYHTGVYDRAYCEAGLCRQTIDPAKAAADAHRDGMDWLEQDGLRLLREFRDSKLPSGNRTD